MGKLDDIVSFLKKIIYMSNIHPQTKLDPSGFFSVFIFEKKKNLLKERLLLKVFLSLSLYESTRERETTTTRWVNFCV